MSGDLRSKESIVESKMRAENADQIPTNVLPNSVTIDLCKSNIETKVKTGQTESKSMPNSNSMSSTAVAEMCKSLDLTDAMCDSQKPKKSLFQITKVVSKVNETKETESIDDLDETTNTEDMSFDLSRTTDAEQEPLSASTVHSPGGVEDAWSSQMAETLKPAQASELKAVKASDAHSRFKIVKIESKDRLKRGRWTCHNFNDPEQQTDKQQNSGEQVGMTVTNSIYYIPSVDDQMKTVFAPIVYNEGHPVLEPNPLKSPLYVQNNAVQQFFRDQQQWLASGPFGAMDIHPIDDQDVLSRVAPRQGFQNADPRTMGASESQTADLTKPYSQLLNSDFIPNYAVDRGRTMNAQQVAGFMESGEQMTSVLKRAVGQTSPLMAMESALMNSSSLSMADMDERQVHKYINMNYMIDLC
jgi:hypothetical protein